MLVQLCTGHITLNWHLYEIDTWETLHCAGCRVASKTVMHFLLECPKYMVERDVLHSKVEGRQLELTALLTDQKKVGALVQGGGGSEGLSHADHTASDQVSLIVMTNMFKQSLEKAGCDTHMVCQLQ